LGDVETALVDLHHLAEQALAVLRSRVDFDDMADEYTPVNLSDETKSTINFIVGREYDHFEWFALEIEPENQDVVERFKWGGEQPLVPYFRVRYAGIEYTSRDMGLGEFCVHFLFWILEQYRESETLLLLLDEPDAFLPPVGVAKLLERLMKVCLDRNWRAIISTHSEEMIRQAQENEAFVLLRLEQDGRTRATHCSEDPQAGYTLLTQPSVRLLVFCEDESASILLRAILDSNDFQLSKEVSIVWGGGNGYMINLRRSMPRPPRPDVSIAFMFDGDQRGDTKESSERQWPALFLPTSDDPDSLFVSLRTESVRLARRLGVSVSRLQEMLGFLEGEDPHDWVNALCKEFGRQSTLAHLALLWCELHPEDAQTLTEQIRLCAG
jgi:hypothetical protein